MYLDVMLSRSCGLENDLVLTGNTETKRSGRGEKAEWSCSWKTSKFTGLISDKHKKHNSSTAEGLQSLTTAVALCVCVHTPVC